MVLVQINESFLAYAECKMLQKNCYVLSKIFLASLSNAIYSSAYLCAFCTCWTQWRLENTRGIFCPKILGWGNVNWLYFILINSVTFWTCPEVHSWLPPEIPSRLIQLYKVPDEFPQHSIYFCSVWLVRFWACLFLCQPIFLLLDVVKVLWSMDPKSQPSNATWK